MDFRLHQKERTNVQTCAGPPVPPAHDRRAIARQLSLSRASHRWARIPWPTRSFILHVCVLTVCAAPDCDSACLASLKASGSFQSGSSLESSSNSGSRILAFFFNL